MSRLGTITLMAFHISSAKLTEADIIERLGPHVQEEPRGAVPLEPDSPSSLALPRPAAVLMPLIRMPAESGETDWHILYTRRTDLVKHHKGQVCFPGGRSDPEDPSPEATALREAFEEIGLGASHVRILGRMDEFVTITNYLVTPVVGVIPWPYTFTLEPKEVSRVFTIPMDWLADSNNYEIRQRELPPDFPVPPRFGSLQIVRFKPYHGEVLWGATAEATLRLIERLGMAF